MPLRLFSDVGAKMSMFDSHAKQHKENQMINPFSDWDGSGTRRKLSRDDPDYGKPLEGSKTAERGRQAQLQMIADMVEMCDLIFDCGMRSPDGRGAICFGDVFRLYNAINDKCVGLLMRGRKHNILDFEGEMLFQRRDDDKMIELLLPLNTIRFKYGMHERAGCGEVRPDLIEELEKKQREKQPARSRSMETLGLPPPTLHKSRSMELARDAAKSDDGWHLTVGTPRMGHSAENLTQIAEDGGALTFTAAPEGAEAGLGSNAVAEGAVGGDGEAKEAAAGEKSNDTVEMEPDSASGGAATVKWEVDSDDADETQEEEKQDNASATAPVMWPEVKIVLHEDEDVKAGITQNDGDSEEVNAEQGNLDEGAGKANETTNKKVSEESEQASLSDTASLAPVEKADIDSTTSPVPDFWGNADENSDKSGIKSAEQTPRSKLFERTVSPSLTEADRAADKTATSDDTSHAGDVFQENAARAVDQQNAEEYDTSAPEQPETEKKAFSFWDVPDEDTPGDVKSSLRHCDTNSDESQKIPKVDGAERTTDEETNDCVESSITNQSEEDQTAHIEANTTSNEKLGRSKGNTSDLYEKTTNDAPATNGEVFSFWDVSDEEDPETTSAFPKSKTASRDASENEDTAKFPDPPETKSNRSVNANASDSTCHGRVPSPTSNEWDATSAEHPSDTASGDDAGSGSADQGRGSPRPLAVPHITLSDESELMPAR